MFDRAADLDLRPTRTIFLNAGETLFRRGDPAEAAFLVQEGCLRLERSLADGSVVSLATASAGESLAEAAIFSPNYRCDAVALQASRVAIYPIVAVRERMSADPRVALDLARFFAGQVHGLRTLLEVRAIKAADERLLAWLRVRALEGDGMSVRLENAWLDVAAQLAMTPEATYRALRRLETDGKLQRQGRRCIRLTPCVD